MTISLLLKYEFDVNNISIIISSVHRGHNVLALWLQHEIFKPKTFYIDNV